MNWLIPWGPMYCKTIAENIHSIWDKHSIEYTWHKLYMLIDSKQLNITMEMGRCDVPNYSYVLRAIGISFIHAGSQSGCQSVTPCILFGMDCALTVETIAQFLSWWISTKQKLVSMMMSTNENIFRVTGHSSVEFTGHRTFDAIFDLLLNKQWWGWLFETLSRP